MAFRVETVVSGIHFPADMMAGDDEKTLYLVNVASGQMGSGAKSGQVLEIKMPNAPESMEGAYVTPIMGGLANPAYLARARDSGRMVVQCFGSLNGSAGYGPWGYHNVGGAGIDQALLECPDGGSAWPCTGQGGDAVKGPRGIALSPDGSVLYACEDEIPNFFDVLSGSLLALSSAGKEYMYQAFTQFTGPDYGYWDIFSRQGFIKIDPAGKYIWMGGNWGWNGSQGARISTSARGVWRPEWGGYPASTWMRGFNHLGVGWRDPLPYGPAIPTPAYSHNGGSLGRWYEPDDNGNGLYTFAYRTGSPYCTGQPNFYNSRGLAVTRGGQVFVSCGDWGPGGYRYGNHLSIGTPFNPGCVLKVNEVVSLPPDYEDTTQPVQPTKMGLLRGWNSPSLLDDHDPTATAT